MPGDGHVDVSYRGLAVGTGLVMRDFGPTTAYVVDVAAPMPVGATLEIAADDGVRFAARVVHVREKTEDVPSGSMRVAVEDIDEAARAWWDARVTTADPAPMAAPARVAAAPAPAVPVAAEVEATEATEAAEPVEPAEPAAQAVPERATPESRSTLMMDAVDLAEIQRMAAGVTAEDFAAREAEAAAAGVTDDDDKKKKRKRRRKKKG